MSQGLDKSDNGNRNSSQGFGEVLRARRALGAALGLGSNPGQNRADPAKQKLINQALGSYGAASCPDKVDPRDSGVVIYGRFVEIGDQPLNISDGDANSPSLEQ